MAVTNKQELNRARYKNYDQIRKQKEIKDSDVAAGTGIAQSIISDWKAGRTTPAFRNIVKIANFLNVPVNAFEVDDERMDDEN